MPADERRAQLLSEAARLFVERGYAGVGIDEIGAAVGISGPAVYRHVAGKEQLVVDITASWLDLALSRIPSRNPAHSEPEHARAVISSLIVTAWHNLPELTVALRYSDRAAEEPDPAEISGDAERSIRRYPRRQVAPALWERFEKLLAHWIPTAQQINPGLDAKRALLYMRAGAGLLLGAASSERDLAQTARFRLLTDAELRLLRTDVTHIVRERAPADNPPRWTRANRREQILDTAVRMFRRRGYSGVSMADIAGSVGVTASASYRHFTSKEALLGTAIDRATERYVLGAGAALARATGPDSALDGLIRAFVTDTLIDTDLAVVHANERYHLSDTDREQIARRRRVLLDEWSLALASLRPELNSAARELLILGCMRMIVELVDTYDVPMTDPVVNSLVDVCHAVLGVEQLLDDKPTSTTAADEHGVAGDSNTTPHRAPTTHHRADWESRSTDEWVRRENDSLLASTDQGRQSTVTGLASGAAPLNSGLVGAETLVNEDPTTPGPEGL